MPAAQDQHGHEAVRIQHAKRVFDLLEAAAEAEEFLSSGGTGTEAQTVQLRKNINWLPAGPGFVQNVAGHFCRLAMLSQRFRDLWKAGVSPQPSRWQVWNPSRQLG